MTTTNDTFTTMSETDLLERLLRNESLAWKEFCRRYDRLIWRCITKVTSRFSHILSPEDTREVYSNFLLVLMSNDMRKLRLYRPEKGNRFSTWIGLLAINSAWDYLRGVSRQPTSDPLSLAEDRPELSPDPLEWACRREDCDRVGELLKGFSSRDRTFVSLYFVDGRSPEEIAEEMGISVKTVYSKKHKIRTRLEKMLTAHGFSVAA